MSDKHYRRAVLVELYRSYLNDLSGQTNRKTIENGGVGIHRLIPLEIKNNIGHQITVLSYSLIITTGHGKNNARATHFLQKASSECLSFFSFLLYNFSELM